MIILRFNRFKDFFKSLVFVLIALPFLFFTGCSDDSGNGNIYDHISSATDTYFIGSSYYTSNWRTNVFEGTGIRKWTNDAQRFEFEWNTINGDQIGRIGRNTDSDPEGAVQIKYIPENLLMSASFEIQDYSSSDGGWSIWAVYGWTHREYISWPPADGNNEGWDNEFYIVFATDLDLAAAGSVLQGDAEIDGITYSFYKNNMPWGGDNQTQWMAVAENPPVGTVSIDVQKFLDYWTTIDGGSGIPDDDYLVDLTFAIEAFGKSEGRLILFDIVIP